MKIPVFAIALVTLLASSAEAAYLANIAIDGASTDWTSVGANGLFHFRDRNETSAQSGGGTDIPDARDISDVYLANNGTYLYWAIRTYGNLSGTTTLQLFLDLSNNTANGGAFGNDDRYIEVVLNGAGCTSMTVYRASNDNQVSNPGCGSGANDNVQGTGAFIEGRVLLTQLYTGPGAPAVPANGNLLLGLHVVFAGTSGATELAPGIPQPTFMDYDNRANLVPTFVRVRGMTAEADHNGVLVRWRTSTEYFSAGTWVVRADGDAWVPVSAVPQATQNLPTGDSYAVVDPVGRPGDVYALVEVDSRESVHVFGPVDAVAAKVELPGSFAAQRLGVDDTFKRRALALDMNLRQRSAALLALQRGETLVRDAVPTVDVDVTREGLYVVCDSDTLRWGGVPNVVSSRAGMVRGFAVSEPCDGLGFYAPAPSSPYAPYEVYRVALAAQRVAPAFEARSETYDGPLASAYLTTTLMPRRYLDWRDGAPNRFFWSFASSTPTAPLAVPGIDGNADLTLDVHPLSGGATHTIVVASDHELGRATVGAGWSTIALPGITLANAPAITFAVDAPPEVIETVLLADARLRYRGQAAMASGVARFGVDGDTWTFVSQGAGFALDVTNPLRPTMLVTAMADNGFAVRSAAETREVIVARELTSLAPSLTPEETLFEESGAAVDYLVLTPAVLEGVARELATLHEEEGLRSAVITYESLYARFTGSNPDPSAVTKLLDWAAINWAAAPRYVALVGATSADPHGYTGTLRPADAPLVSGIDPGFNYRRFSDLDLVGNHAVAIGRISTSDAGELGRYIDKLRAYRGTSRTGRWAMANGVSSANDPGFAGLVDNIAAQVGESVAVKRMIQPTAEDLVGAWGEADVIVYAGHGDSESWADDLLYPELAPNLAAARPPVTLSTACMDGMITSANGGLAWSLVSAEVGHGSIAAIAPSSIVEPIQASAFLGRAAAAVANGEAARWGDAWLAAQRSDVSSAARSMILIGDPALIP